MRRPRGPYLPEVGRDASTAHRLQSGAAARGVVVLHDAMHAVVEADLLVDVPGDRHFHATVQAQLERLQVFPGKELALPVVIRKVRLHVPSDGPKVVVLRAESSQCRLVESMGFAMERRAVLLSIPAPAGAEETRGGCGNSRATCSCPLHAGSSGGPLPSCLRTRSRRPGALLEA